MEQIRAILKGRIAFAMLVTVGILLYACVSTSGDSHTYAVSNDAVAQVVHDAIAGDHDATPLNGSPVADCTGERNCTIAYTVQPPMEDSGIKRGWRICSWSSPHGRYGKHCLLIPNSRAAPSG